ncbi:uncharacterized protein [Amphiura filiformis]|uniref:uncharacterized protein isoform X2 n=1 Tax=Amphiura filiformis TaxID=82378 RepID=UPI003B215A81
MGSIKYRGCLCEYCTNIDLKLAAINQLAHRQQLPSRFQGVYSIAKVSMCPKEGDFNRRACIERKCKDCGTMKIQDHLQDIVEKQGDKPITWKKWEKKTSQLNGVTVSRQVINKVEGTLQQCINELKVESESITAHLFNATWQNRQFSQLTKNLPAGWMVLVLDFAENYTCKYQDEIQSAHWYHSNATVHPIVAYHSCPHCGKTMMTSLVMISPDKTHDFNAVNSFMDLAINHLKSHLGADHVTDVVRFSDGCGAQYKSKGPFYDLSCAQENYNTNVRHEFFGSRHGKGPSDGESAVVKRQASLAVLGGKVTINDARDLFKYCLDKVATKTPPPGECQHFQRTFFYVDDIERDRDMGSAPLKTVKGTRLLHSVRGITAGKICIRNLSCFCFACTQGNDNTCDNESHVDAWTDVTIGTPRATATARDENSQATDAQTVQTHSPESPADMNHQATNLVTTGDDAETSHMSQTAAVHPSSEGAAAHPSSSEGTASVHPVPSEAEAHLSSSKAKAHPSEAEAHPSGAEDEANAMNVTIGDLVAVALNQCNKRGKVTAKAIYMAEVVDLLIDDDHVVVKYMVKRGRNLYIWPKEEEMEFSTEPMASILTKLSPPQHNTREQYLFDSIELANLERNLTASKVPFHYK